MAVITVDQDALGDLYLHHDGHCEVWLVSDRVPGAKFDEDVRMLLVGQVPAHWRWSMWAFEYAPASTADKERVVNWWGMNEWQLVARPTEKTLHYLGTLPEEADELLDQDRRPGRPPVHLVARQRLHLEFSRALSNELDILARRAGMTRTAYVEHVLINHVKSAVSPANEITP